MRFLFLKVVITKAHIIIMTLIRSVISLYEQKVIEGRAYIISSFRTLNNNEIVNLTITAPIAPPETIGLSFDVDPGDQLLIEIFQPAILNVTPGGTILTLINTNQASGNVANTVIRENPTIDSDGSLILDSLLGAGRKNSTVGQGVINVVTLLAAGGTTLVRLTSGSASNTVNFILGVIEN